MVYQLSVEEREVLKTLRNDLIILSKKLLALLINLFYSIKWSVIKYIESLEDFRVSNIKQNGFIEVLTKRAHNFFKIEEESRASNNAPKKKKPSLKRIVKKAIKIILFPIYLVLIVLEIMLKREKKLKKNVINSYTP